VVQLLRLPGVAKIEAADMRVMGTGCHSGSARMWNGMGTDAAHRAGWDAGLRLCVWGAGAGSSIRTDAASGTGMGAGRVLNVHQPRV
jgi:hypothetical protein